MREKYSAYNASKADRKVSEDIIIPLKDEVDTESESDTSYTEEELEALANGEFLGGNDDK